MYVCMYVYMCACVSLCVCMYVCMYVFVHVSICLSVCMYVFISVQYRKWEFVSSELVCGGANFDAIDSLGGGEGVSE